MRNIIIIIIFCLGAISTFGQDTDSTISNSETQFSDSIAKFNLLQKEFKESRDEYNNGVQFFELKNFSDAINSFDKAISIDSTFIAAYYNRGICYLELSKHDNAVSDFTKTFLLDSTHILSLFKRADMYRRLNKNSLANSDYKKVLELDENNYKAYYLKGIAFI